MPTVEEELRRIADDLEENLDAVVRRHLTTKVEFPGYDQLAQEESMAASMAVGRAAVVLLREDRPYEDIAPVIRAVAAKRAVAGVPAESVLRVLQHGQLALCDAVVEAARRLGVRPEAALEASARLVRSTEAAMADVVAVYEDHEGVESRRAVELLRRLFAGDTAKEGLPADVWRDIDPDVEYVPVLARCYEPAARDRLDRALRSAAKEQGGLVAWLGDDLAGLLRVAPVIAQLAAVVAVGPPARVDAMRDAHRLATRLLDAAEVGGLTGVVSLESMGTRLPVALEHSLGDHLIRRYVEPVLALGGFGEELLRTIEVYLEEGLRPNVTARRLIVHRNTLTKRLRRFEELTGADLEAADDLFSVWWAIERHRLVTAERRSRPRR